MMQKYILDENNGLKSVTNSEVERGETLLKASTGETFIFDTKRTHKANGLKVLLNEGDRVYSHHLKVDKDLVEEITGKKLKGKQSYADLSKRYDTSQYIDRLENDKTLDSLARKTTILNLRNMLAKQGEIFHVQENSKEKKKKTTKFQVGGYYRPYNPQDVDRFNDVFQDFDPNRLNLQIPSHQPRRNDGLYGAAIPLQEFYGNNPQYDFSNFDATNKQDVLGFQTDYNQRIRDRAYNLGLGEKEAINRYGFSQTNPVNRLDGKAGGYTTSRQLTPLDPINSPRLGNNPLEQLPVDSYLDDRLDIRPQKPKVHTSPKETYDNYTPYNETPIGIDPEKLVNGVQQGLLLSQLATLESENPYYTGTTLKAPITRFDPINTRQAERLYNLGKETLSKSNLPESAKQARLGQLQAQLAEQSSNVSLTNSQNRTNLRNQNNQTAINVYNQNEQNKTQANYTYMRERARGNELRELQKQHFLDNALNHWRSSLESKENIGLLNQTSRNFNFNSRNGVQYQSGQGYDIDPILRGFNNTK